MRRCSGFLAILALTMPALAQAQKRPSNSMHTRSAEVYLDRVHAAGGEAERTELLQRALEVLAQGAQADPGNPKIWMLAGQAYVRLGDVAGADSSFDKAEAIYPEYAPEIGPERLSLWITKYNAGVVAIQDGRTDDAIGLFQAADRIYAGRPDAAVLLGSLLAQKGDLAGAESAYRTALEITRGPAAAQVEESDRALWLEQQETAASRLASLLIQTGKAEEAMAVYRALLQSQPGNSRARIEYAAALATAGQNDEAARIYEALLGTADLSDTDWFNAGVRMYRAENYELAVKAFRKSIESNPHSRDTFYNLGQALYAAATAAEEQLRAATDADRPAIEARLAAFYEQLLETGHSIRGFDPNYRNAVMMVAQAQRSLGEKATDPAVKKTWQDQLVTTLQVAEDMTVEISGVEMRRGEAGVSVSGTLTNLKLPAGQAVTVEFTLIGESGEPVLTRQVPVTTGPADATSPFDFEVSTDARVSGWKYRVVT